MNQSLLVLKVSFNLGDGEEADRREHNNDEQFTEDPGDAAASGMLQAAQPWYIGEGA